jgi:hypothetical protein
VRRVSGSVVVHRLDPVGVPYEFLVTYRFIASNILKDGVVSNSLTEE